MAQNTELDELKQAMQELEEENASMKEEITSIKHENMSMKDMIQAMRSEKLAVLENCQQRQPERRVKATTTETKYTNPKFLTDEEKKEIQFKLFSNSNKCMHRPSFNDLIPSRMRYFTERQMDHDGPIWPFLTRKGGMFTTPTAGDYRFDVAGWIHFEDDKVNNKVDWYLGSVPKEFYVDTLIVMDSSDDEEEETDESRLKMSIYNENKRQHFLFSSDNETVADALQRSVTVECDRDISFWIEAVVVEGPGVCNAGTEFSGVLVR